MNTCIGLRFCIIFVCLGFISVGCSTLKVEDKSPSTAFSDGRGTTIGRIYETELSAQQTEHSGFVLLDTGHDALLKRLSLLDLSEKAVDLQYYIWNSDQSGRLMAQRVYLAAERGVRIRLLLDDFNIGDRDPGLLIMDAHPNIEVRIYNPNAARSGVRKILGLLGGFSRLNQRMHNKSFTVDASVTIVGGRNIGDEYFDLHPELNFRDRDLLAIGPVVREVAESFDAYWNSERAFAITNIADGKPTQAEIDKFKERLASPYQNDTNKRGVPDIEYSVSETQLQAWLGGMTWAPARLVYDQPMGFEETDNNTPKKVANMLVEIARSASRELLIESPYLIPGDEGVALLGQLTQSGVQVKALTNSLASNDLTTNHAGYTRRRKGLLKSGVELFEFRPDAKSCQHLVVGAGRCDDDTLFGLHAKSMVFDRNTVFVGSFNLNQRSVFLNSETALIIHSPELANKIARDIEENLSLDNSWRVRLEENGNLQWIGMEDGVISSYNHEPHTGFWRRFSSGLLSIIPFERY